MASFNGSAIRNGNSAVVFKIDYNQSGLNQQDSSVSPFLIHGSAGVVRKSMMEGGYRQCPGRSEGMLSYIEAHISCF